MNEEIPKSMFEMLPGSTRVVIMDLELGLKVMLKGPPKGWILEVFADRSLMILTYRQIMAGDANDASGGHWLFG